jgi:2-polyprenyl-3-methyl-5-hydroxy-6-metoxy-1,4-benzoquinol methylase
MKSIQDGAGYNERLFSGGLRRYLHFSRFKWISSEIAKRRCQMDALLELGCFDGKLLHFLPSHPKRYVGFDANWEAGLDLARSEWAGNKNISFLLATTPADMRLDDSDIFDIAIAMETLEHVPPQLVDG